MSLPYIIAYCAAAILAARVLDFLLGEKRRKRVKDALIFRPWFLLQGSRPLSILRSSANMFSDFINALFGSALISVRAYWASLIIGFAVVFLYNQLDKPLGLSQFVDHEESMVVFVGSLCVINPVFDFVSFAVTRYLARRIATSRRLWPAFTLWFLDLALCALLTTATYVAVDSFTLAIEPRHGLSIWFGVLTRDVSVFTAVTGLIPTLIHLGFFVFFAFAALTEVARRVLCFLLERFDESDQSPLAVITLFLAAIIGLLSSVARIASTQ